MQDLDKAIDKAIGEEERELLRQMGEEPGFVAETLGIFGGRNGWVNALMVVTQTLLFIVGIWAAWHFFSTDDPATQLRWGLPATVLILMSLIIKMAVWPTVQTNRVLRELKRIEFRLSRTVGRSDSAMDR